jgi:hypothetical protein
MNDAYTVGLTLALEDGVSAGIETIRRELGALDQAIVASTANLVRLQEVARGAVNAGVAQAGAMAALTRESAAAAARQAAVPPRTPVVTMPDAASAGPAAQTGTQDAAIATPPRASMAATTQDDGEAAPAAPVMRASAEPSPQTPKTSSAAVVGAPVQGLAAGIAQAAAPITVAPAAAFEQPVRARPIAAEPPVSMVPSPAIREPSAPPAPMPTSLTMIEPPAPPTAPPPSIGIAAMPVALPVASERRQSDQAAAPVTRIETAAPAAFFEAPRQPDMTPAPSMAPPPRGSPMPPTTEPSRRPPHREHAASVAPRQATDRHREQAMSGTIVIDGTELGRWMADYLAHAASRPPSGGVGFDPRMTPVWAGAPIGA